MNKLKTEFRLHNTITGYDFKVDAPLSRARAIRIKCLECQGGSPAAVRDCHISDCSLWSWRSGRIPREKTPQKALVSNTAGVDSDEHASDDV